ncbi:hypothetical protein Cantr_00374 [Candida viswanathii]|uniref:Uncharacterized protein n=1 Tax=Candida viswanathii TaxID=5486 RepID=A0A367YF74_9ASCO|nr:hypothetical protein Cantr_00374 [Candida viswanathii]
MTPLITFLAFILFSTSVACNQLTINWQDANGYYQIASANFLKHQHWGSSYSAVSHDTSVSETTSHFGPTPTAPEADMVVVAW